VRWKLTFWDKPFQIQCIEKYDYFDNDVNNIIKYAALCLLYLLLFKEALNINQRLKWKFDDFREKMQCYILAKNHSKRLNEILHQLSATYAPSNNLFNQHFNYLHLCLYMHETSDLFLSACVLNSLSCYKYSPSPTNIILHV
jgi:hypothetical protein